MKTAILIIRSSLPPSHSYVFKIFIAQKVCTACSRKSCKIVPNLNKYLHYDVSETKVNLNISVKTAVKISIKKNTVTVHTLHHTILQVPTQHSHIVSNYGT